MKTVDRLWTYASASVRGTSHERVGVPCQDAALIEVVDTPSGPVLIAFASDGAGSALRAELGSETTCAALGGEVRDYLRCAGLVENITRDVVDEWCLGVQRSLTGVAAECDAPLRDFACTLLAVVADQERAVFLQLGDGAIVIGTPGEYEPVFWPQNGEYANTTYFITEPEALGRLQYVVRDAPLEIALFSDGIQTIALRNADRAAQAPFFEKMFAPFRTGPSGLRPSLSASLAAFLDSPLINDKTDDDKTLVLVSRARSEKDVQPVQLSVGGTRSSREPATDA